MKENEGKTNIALFFFLCECVCVYSRISVVDILKLLSIFVKKKRSYQFDLHILFLKITITEWAFFGLVSFFIINVFTKVLSTMHPPPQNLLVDNTKVVVT